MTEREAKLKKLLVLAGQATSEDYHGERYWDLFHERQALMIKMLSYILEDQYVKEVEKDKKVEEKPAKAGAKKVT